MSTQNNEQRKSATLDDVVAALQKNRELLDEIATWLKVGGYDKVKKLLEFTLDAPEKRVVYHLSDGKGSKEVGVE